MFLKTEVYENASSPGGRIAKSWEFSFSKTVLQ